ncbi:hypothetical protein N9850_10325 [Granulosicoccus sp.]|nr:hypothetical protein [Granulosicoccus sp.]MDB4224156.1 hypothetical protein [Granulosicoccus sp.]
MKFSKILMMLTFFSYPYYLFPSGGFQPATGIIVCIFVTLLFTAPKQFKFSLSMKILICYTIYAAAVNTFWYFNTYNESLLEHLYITIFGTFIFVTLGNVFNHFTRSDAKMFIGVIAITLATQAALLTFGLVKDVGGGRQIIWFNNPNQLGYFCVLSATLAIVTSYYYKIKSLIIPIVIIGIGIFLTAFTLSRAALGALLLFIPIILFLSTNLSIFKKIVMVAILSISSVFVTDLYLQSETYAALERRIERSQDRATETTAEVRHFDRIWLYPDYLGFGAGKGAYERFGKPQEIHNLFLSVFFSYGVIGILLYLAFWLKIIPNLQVLIYMAPVLVYNMTHNGGRVIVFWFTLALIASAATRKLKRSRKR